MILERRSLVPVLVLVLGLGTAVAGSGQSTDATLNLEPLAGASLQARGAGARNSAVSSAQTIQYGFACTAHVWALGEVSPWLYASVDLWNESFTAFDHAYASGYWEIWAQAVIWLDSTAYDQLVTCTADMSGGALWASGIAPGIPEGETTESDGWEWFGETLHRWMQTLTPQDANYNGRSVKEQNGVGPVLDTCWFPGSRVAHVSGITGGEWPVSSNKWGPDSVGWMPEAVVYYRDNGRAPCYFTLAQDMLINVWGSWVPYRTNSLSAGFTDATVWSQRNGQTADRIWP